MAGKRQNIVIVGGGAAGIPTARELAAKLDTSKYRLVVITARPDFTHLPAMIRTTVTSEGKLEDLAFMPYGDSLGGKGEIKVGKVVSFTDDGEKGGQVVLADGERVDYSILILASGSLWEGPLALPDSKKEIAEWLKTWRSRFEKANSVALVGGGSVGIEYAGEIKEFYPAKKVTIVHGQNLPMNAVYPERWRRDLLSRVQKKGVDVILGDYLDSITPTEDGTITTRNGTVIKADLVVNTRGGRPNTALVSASVGAGALTKSGHVKVLPTLQLKQHPRIFAAGDIIDWEEQKQAGKTRSHAAVIAANVVSLLHDQPAHVEYKGSYELIAVTIGKSGGSSYFGVLWGLVFGNIFTTFLKSKGLVIEMTRKSFNFSSYVR